MVMTVPFAVPSGITKVSVNAVSVPFSPTLYVSVGAGISVSASLFGFFADTVTVIVFPAISEAGSAATVIVGSAFSIVNVQLFAVRPVAAE